MLSCKISNFLCPLKDNLGLKTPGIYIFFCKGGQVCSGKIGQYIETRKLKDTCGALMPDSQMSTVAEYSMK